MGEAKKKPGRPRKLDRHVAPRKMIVIPEPLFLALARVAGINERPVGWEAARAIRAYLQAEYERLGIAGPDDGPA